MCSLILIQGNGSKSDIMEQRESITIDECLSIMTENKKKYQNIVEDAPAPKSYIKEMEIIYQSLSKQKKPDSFNPSPEWCSKMLTWFSHLRSHLKDIANSQQSIDFQTAKRKIESNECPNLSDLLLNDAPASILSFLNSQKKVFSVSDLTWVFYSLSRIDSLLTPDVCVILQDTLVNLYTQLAKFQCTDPQYPYLAINAIIISKYFNQN